MNSPGAALKFRKSRPDDSDQMYEVWRTSVLATHSFLLEADFKEICDSVRRHYLPNNCAIVAVNESDCIVGFMEYSDAEIVALFIHSDFRGRGLGRTFVTCAASQSAKLNVTVNSQNIQAVGFYKKMGFVAGATSAVDDEGRPYPVIRMHRLPGYSDGS